MRFSLVLAVTIAVSACSVDSAVGPFDSEAPERFTSPGIPVVHPVPSPQQLAYQKMETNIFIHFGPNTFTNQEWGDGTTDPDVFNPVEFDPDQWLSIFKRNGFKGVTLVTKHVDGFLLWPSKHSSYSVKESAWRDGEGDVVKEVADATRAAGLEFGVYLAPWDRNNPSWGTPRYNEYFVATLWELITRDYYHDLGDIYQVWFDYGHDFEAVTQAQLDSYDLRRWVNEVRWNQPGALVTPETDVYFPGNEDGVAPDPNWSVRDNLSRWAPFECDVTLRGERSWFWHPQDTTRPLEDLVDIYFTSVGRGCTLLLAVGPDTRGLVAPDDEARMDEWRAALDSIFDDDLAHRAAVSASSTRPGSEWWAVGAAVDDDPDSFWVAEADTASVEIDLGRPRTVNVLELAEPIRYGQRVGAFRLDAWDGTSWTTAARGTTVNYKRLLRFPPITARRWRVVIEESRAVPALSQIGLYSALDWADDWSTREP